MQVDYTDCVSYNLNIASQQHIMALVKVQLQRVSCTTGLERVVVRPLPRHTLGWHALSPSPSLSPLSLLCHPWVWYFSNGLHQH